jgi:tRNA G18 (ribose-2'-O)-methylase SpoU
MRSETRLQRYERKQPAASKFPIRIATVEFKHDINLAFVVRAAACFGAAGVDVIGSVPPRNVLRDLSGSLSELIDIEQFANPQAFLAARCSTVLVSLELANGSIALDAYAFDASAQTTLIVGHEETGVPAGILLNSDVIVHVPMPGVGYCLNTAMSAHVALYEYVRQQRSRFEHA